MTERLRILYVSVPPTPPRYGAQVRTHELMTALAGRHEVSALCCAADRDGAEISRRAMREYCRDVDVVAEPRVGSPVARRICQLRSLASTDSFERKLFTSPELQRRIDRMLASRRFDIVNVEGPFFAQHRFRSAAPGVPPPRLVLGEHNIEYDVVRQVARNGSGVARRLYSEINWRKLRREEVAVWARFDAITVPSERDAERIRAARPGARITVVPNAIDLDRYRPREEDPRPDGRTLVFFGALNYFPNTDGILFFLDAVWPRVVRRHPGARLRILGRCAPRALRRRRAPGVEIAGFVDDLRPHLAEAAAIVVPLRMGGGTRLKILEAMAMGRPVVSTALGAEGLDVTHGREILIADEPEQFAYEIGRLLDDPALGDRLGRASRSHVEARYSWRASARALEQLFFDLVEPQVAPPRAEGAPLTSI